MYIHVFHITAISLVALYVVMVLRWVKGWRELKEFTYTPLSSATHCFSIVVPFRNEEKQLAKVIACLKAQNFNTQNFEVLLMDDHSEDRSFEIGESEIGSQNNFHLFKNEISGGKKRAIRCAIEKARFEWIITLDADIEIGSNWLLTIDQFVAAKKPEFIILPLLYKLNETFLGKMEALEFMSLTGVTAGSTQMGSPLMCNGANLAFRKELYMKNRNNINESISSGDDMFLLLAVKKISPESIHWLHHLEATGHTNPTGGFKEFIEQRVRWSSKAGKLLDKDILFSGSLILLCNMALLLSLFNALLFRGELLFLLMLFCVKVIVDFFMVEGVIRWTGHRNLLGYFLPLSICYPFYALLIPVAGMFYKPRWKGRKIKT
jgi:poly-beta-1,6-N-acetyl-D-glucosamine synthase